MHFVRNSEACTQCGACAADCSPLRYGLIVSRAAVADPADPRCERCGHCYSVCPRGAIGVVEEPAFPSLFGRGRLVVPDIFFGVESNQGGVTVHISKMFCF